MKTYIITFVGCEKNAIGRCYRITETVKAENEEQANISLYDKYEHIFPIDIKLLGE